MAETDTATHSVSETLVEEPQVKSLKCGMFTLSLQCNVRLTFFRSNLSY